MLEFAHIYQAMTARDTVLFNGPTLLSALAGYGPFLAALILYMTDQPARRAFISHFTWRLPLKYLAGALVLFSSLCLLSTVPFYRREIKLVLPEALSFFVLLFFLYQMITTATEEIGWRGFLLNQMLKSQTPWQAALDLGLIWALWHGPVVFYVYSTQALSLWQMLVSFLGFILGTMAMSVIHTYYYIKTRNVFFNMVLHALVNSLLMVSGLILSASYSVSALFQVILWVYLIIFTRSRTDFFDQIQKKDI